MKRYKQHLLVFAFCAIIYGCGTMPAPMGFSQNSGQDLTADATEKGSQQASGVSQKNNSDASHVSTNKSLKQVLTINGIAQTKPASNTTNDTTTNVTQDSDSDNLLVNHTEKDRHNRILAAIKTSDQINKPSVSGSSGSASSPVSTAKKIDNKSNSKLDNKLDNKPQKPLLPALPKGSNNSSPKPRTMVATKKKFITATPKNNNLQIKTKLKSKKAKAGVSEDTVKFTLANRYYQSGKYQNSIDILETSKNDNSTNIRNRDLLVLAYTAYARELVTKADLLEAQAILEKALTMQPKNKTIQRQLSGIKNVREADRIYKQAVDSYNKGNRQIAFKSFSRVLKLNPGHKKAKTYYSKIKTIVVDDYHKKALQYYRRQKLAQAINEWNSLLKVDPGNDLARIYRSRAIELQKKFEKL